MMKKQVKGQKIAWLDSVQMWSHVHRTENEGVTTVCGHPTKENFDSGRWTQVAEAPRKILGNSRFCRRCFKDGGKPLPWVPGGVEHEAKERWG